jgi:hypothetical protein
MLRRVVGMGAVLAAAQPAAAAGAGFTWTTAASRSVREHGRQAARSKRSPTGWQASRQHQQTRLRAAGGALESTPGMGDRLGVEVRWSKRCQEGEVYVNRVG